MPETAIWWIRRDLRLHDNQALNAALETHRAIIPVFILDDRLLKSSYVAQQRVAFLFNGLRSLHTALLKRGGRLIVRRGEPRAILADLFQASGADRIYAEPDCSPFASQRDRLVEAELPVEWVGSPAILPPGSVLKSNSEPYIVFTPFSRAWKALPTPTAPSSDPVLDLNTPGELASLSIPEQPALLESVPFQAGETEASRRLDQFTRGSGAPIFDYAAGRNLLGEDGTSRLSPYLRFGMISPRRVFAAARQVVKAADNARERKAAEILAE